MLEQFHYDSDLIGGSLMVRESRLIADLLLREATPEQWHQAIQIDNILQKRTAASAQRNATAIRKRLERLDPEDCLYMGDDWPDLSAFAIAGMKVTVPNGHVEVRRRADLVTQAMGGRGAVREVCDMLLMAKGTYQELLEKYTAIPH